METAATVAGRLVAVAALVFVTGCAWPTRDPDTVRAIAIEGRQLIASFPADVHVPRDRWPPAIARLSPEQVLTDRYGVEITTRIDFDGGWGYRVVALGAPPPDPAGRYSALGNGVYWFHPY